MGTSGEDFTDRSGAVGISIALNAKGTQLGEPKVGQRGAPLAVDVAALPEFAASAPGDYQRQIIVLMGGAIPHARPEGKNGVVQQRGAVGFLNLVHALEQPGKGRDMEAVQLEELLHVVANGVGHGVVTVGLVEDAFPVGGGRPSLGSQHQGADIGQAVLQGYYQKVAHQVKVFIAWKMLGRSLDPGYRQLGLHFVNAIHPCLDRPDGLQILAEFFPVFAAQPFLKLAGIAQGEVRDVADARVGLHAEEPVVNLARVSHRGRDVTRAIPGHVVEVDRLDVVFVIIAAELQR